MKCDGAGRPDELAAVCQERDALAARVAQLEAENAVLLEHVKHPSEPCDICKNWCTELPCGDDPGCPSCEECGYQKNVCCLCNNLANFKFVGVGDGNG